MELASCAGAQVLVETAVQASHTVVAHAVAPAVAPAVAAAVVLVAASAQTL